MHTWIQYPCCFKYIIHQLLIKRTAWGHIKYWPTIKYIHLKQVTFSQSGTSFIGGDFVFKCIYIVRAKISFEHLYLCIYLIPKHVSRQTGTLGYQDREEKTCGYGNWMFWKSWLSSGQVPLGTPSWKGKYALLITFTPNMILVLIL